MLYTKICLYCTKPFTTKTNGRKLCSTACHYASMRTLSDNVCERCGKNFHPYTSHQRFCSRACFGDSGYDSAVHRTWTDDQLQEMIHMYEAGKSGGQIAISMGISKRIVYLALKNSGMTMRAKTYVYIPRRIK